LAASQTRASGRLDRKLATVTWVNITYRLARNLSRALSDDAEHYVTTILWEGDVALQCPRLGRQPAGTPRACPMAPPLSGRTRAWEAVREVRARTVRVTLSRGRLGCGLGRNIVGSASMGHRPNSCADCRHGRERSIALWAGHTRPTARSTLGPFSNSYSVFSLWLGPGDSPARENASARQI
jgi:hypothetical protein